MSQSPMTAACSRLTESPDSHQFTASRVLSGAVPPQLQIPGALLTIGVSPRAVLRGQDERAGCGDRHHVPLSIVGDSGSRGQAECGVVWGPRLLRVCPDLLEAQSWGVAKGLLLGMAFGGDGDIVHGVIATGSLLFLWGSTGDHHRWDVLDGAGRAQRDPVHSNVSNVDRESDRNLWRLEGNLEEKGGGNSGILIIYCWIPESWDF